MAGMGPSYHDIPKAELHLHLEGSIAPSTLRELDPSLTPEEMRERYRYADFPAFIESFKWVIGHLRSPADYALITRRLLERLESENVRYAEITLGMGVVLWRGQEPGPIYDAIREECARSPVETWWVLDAIRQFGAEHGMAVAKLAAERVGQGVVAFGIGGNEALGPVDLFGDVFAFARESGLRLTIHAGETVGPESVWGALRLGAERIGHGVRASEDPNLVAYLREHDVPLEVCITSNIATGAIANLRVHPVRKLYEAGVPIVLNTDDPAMFHTTLEREYEIAESEFGFSRPEILGLIENAFRYSFVRFPSVNNC
jgi:aminodeoxyfutalosine deaminase